MQTVQLALVSELPPDTLPVSELLKVSAALQKQIVRDVAPAWSVSATVDAFVNLQDVPPGHWPILVCDDIGSPSLEGIHKDPDNQPYALVAFKDYWSITASHEAVEMLIDPQGNRLQQGPSPKAGQDQVMFLVEVCDPVYSSDCAYLIDGYPVSNFCTPQFYGLAQSGAHFDMTNYIHRPLDIYPGGYICFMDPADGQWWRWSKFTDLTNGEYISLGTSPVLSAVNLRGWMDQATPERIASLKANPKLLELLRKTAERATEDTARIKRFRELLKGMTDESQITSRQQIKETAR